jgi:hypothetical protein
MIELFAIFFLVTLYLTKCISKVIKLKFDRDYGCDKKTGWTLCIDGKYYVSQLEPSLIICIKKGVKSFCNSEYKSDVVKAICNEIIFR